MNYEQKYKEALVKAREIHLYSGDLGEKIRMEEIFPELKESEDERMIREIKRYIKEQGDKPSGLPNGTADVNSMLSWLEKHRIFAQHGEGIYAYYGGNFIYTSPIPDESCELTISEETPTTDGCMISPNPKSISVAEVQGEQNDKEVREELNSLYRRIDICVSELIGARRTKDIEAEGKALSTMEGLVSQTLQLLSYISDHLNTQNEPTPCRVEQRG